jgi:hypothetical protein
VSDLVKTTARTSLALLALLLTGALLGTSCGTVAPQALSVGSYSLSESEFMDQLASIADNQAYLDSRAAQGNPLTVQGTNDATYSTSFTAQVLNERVSFVLAEQEVEARGLEVTEADRRNAEILLSLNLSPNPQQSDGSTPDPQGLEVLDAFSDGYRTALVDGVANVLVLRRDILEGASTDEGLRALYESRQDNQEDQACVSHILIRAGTGQTAPTAEQLAAARTRVDALADQLRGTADFATLARAESEDPGSATAGGDLGCAPRGTYPDTFDEAVWSQPVGVVSAPVQTDFGWHLILVTKRGQLTFEDLRDQLASAVEQNSDALLADWLQSAAIAADDVTVNPRFGRWALEQGQVVPPPGAQAAAAAGLDPTLEDLLGGGAGTGSGAP